MSVLIRHNLPMWLTPHRFEVYVRKALPAEAGTGNSERHSPPGDISLNRTSGPRTSTLAQLRMAGLAGVRINLMPTAKASDGEGARLLFMSAPRSRHMKVSAEITDFLDWVVVSVIDLDDAVRAIAKSERRSGRTDEGRLKRELAVGAGASRKISVFYRVMTEMTLCRAVDSYLTYLTELLCMIFRASPDSLRSSEEVKLDFVLAHSTRAGLIKAITDRKVNQLSYHGMRDLARFLSRRLGFELFQDHKSLERAVLLVEIRNLIVHARGIVNDTFIQRVAKPPTPRGRQIRLSINDVREYVEFLNDSVADIEGRAHGKFRVKLPYRVPTRSDATGK